MLKINILKTQSEWVFAWICGAVQPLERCENFCILNGLVIERALWMWFTWMEMKSVVQLKQNRAHILEPKSIEFQINDEFCIQWAELFFPSVHLITIHHFNMHISFAIPITQWSGNSTLSNLSNANNRI